MRRSILRIALSLGLIALPLALTACAHTTFDEVEGVPDSRRWSYFEGNPAEVADALRTALVLGGYTVDAVAGGEGGRLFVRVTTSPPGADLAEIVVEPIEVSGYSARAQTVPQARRLSRDLELAVSQRL